LHEGLLGCGEDAFGGLLACAIYSGQISALRTVASLLAILPAHVERFVH
jgi:hypothetical protein